MAEHTLQSVAFPVLDQTQIGKIASCTAVIPKRYKDGETLIAFGERDFKFLIVKSGEVEIIDNFGDEPRTIAIHHKGEFTGDISHLTGRPFIFTAVARGD